MCIYIYESIKDESWTRSQILDSCCCKKGDKARTVPLSWQLLFERNGENMGKLEREDHAWRLKLQEASGCSTSCCPIHTRRVCLGVHQGFPANFGRLQVKLGSRTQVIVENTGVVPVKALSWISTVEDLRVILYYVSIYLYIYVYTL